MYFNHADTSLLAIMQNLLANNAIKDQFTPGFGTSSVGLGQVDELIANIS